MNAQARPTWRDAERAAALLVPAELEALLLLARLPLLPAKVLTEGLLVAASYAVQLSLVFRRRAAAGRQVPAAPPPRELVPR